LTINLIVTVEASLLKDGGRAFEFVVGTGVTQTVTGQQTGQDTDKP
jgi:hypothetical protein